MVTVRPPSTAPYVVAFLFVLLSQAITVPLCLLTHKLKRPVVYVALGLVAAGAGLYFPGLLANVVVNHGFGTPSDCLLGRFCGATTYAFVALRFFGAAVGATPKGADAEAKTWITFATGALDIIFEADGKPSRPNAGAIPKCVGCILLRIAGLSVCSSLSEPFSGYPATALFASEESGVIVRALCTYVDHIYIQLMILYLFLSLLMDVGSLLLLTQGFVPIQGFANPIFRSTSARIFWGKRWNLQVTASFKRCVFTPLHKTLGAPPVLAALVTFISSGLFHEYQVRRLARGWHAIGTRLPRGCHATATRLPCDCHRAACHVIGICLPPDRLFHACQFVLSFPSYRLGRASFFFLLHGLFCTIDALFSRVAAESLKPVPWQLKALAVPILYSPTVPLFANIWMEEGFFALIARLGFLVTP